MIDLNWTPKGPPNAPNSILEAPITLFDHYPYVAIAVEVTSFNTTHWYGGPPRPVHKGASALADVELIKWRRATEDEGFLQTILIQNREYAVYFKPKLLQSIKGRLSHSVPTPKASVL